jgi:uncharacterized repeat protein (TIGR04076 family)
LRISTLVSLEEVFHAKFIYECFKHYELGILLSYRVRICVKEVRGKCAMGYEPGDCFTIERFYITDIDKSLCLHALCSMLTLLMPFLKGFSAKDLGIGKEDDIGYAQCPDPGEPYTCGGTVVFELKRERISEA